MVDLNLIVILLSVLSITTRFSFGMFAVRDNTRRHPSTGQRVRGDPLSRS
jgi:hypothetical protein